MGFQVIILAIMSHSFYRALPGDAPIVSQIIIFGVLFSLALIFLLLLFLGSAALQIFSKGNRTITTEHTITLREDGFVEETAYNITDHKWAAVQKRGRSGRYIFIYIAAHMAHVIPKRAFHSDAEWDAFYAYCRQRTGPVRPR